MREAMTFANDYGNLQRTTKVRPEMSHHWDFLICGISRFQVRGGMPGGPTEQVG